MPNVSNNAIYEHDIKVLQKFGTNGIFIHKVVISGKKLTSVEAIHANECHKDDLNWYRGLCVEKNKNEENE